MSVLDSILSCMEAPPQATVEQRKQAKAEIERRRRLKAEQRLELGQFRKDVEKIVAAFQTSSEPFYEFGPIDKMFRAIVYEIAETNGLLACSFGVDQIDRYTVLYHKNAGPSDDERYVRNNGGKWNDEISAKIEADRLEEKRMYEDEGLKPKNLLCSHSGRGGRARLFVPAGPSYAQKYAHLSTLPDKTAEGNAKYGEVPSQLKRDHRSIEETLNDIKDKKKKEADATPAKVAKTDADPKEVKAKTDTSKPSKSDTIISEANKADAGTSTTNKANVCTFKTYNAEEGSVNPYDDDEGNIYNPSV